MKSIYCIIILLAFFRTHYTRAQYPDPALMNSKELARYNIQQLKNGALLVRLDFRTKAIEILQQSGNREAANQLKQIRKKENKEIMAAFKEYFTFCPVYFFPMDSTNAMAQGKKGGYFLNDSLNVDPAISLKNTFFLVGEQGMLETSLPPDKTRPDQEDVRRGLMSDALLIRNKDLELLRNPFPYYVHWGDWEERVTKLEKRLQRFYSQSK